jgi:hypothetical protein
VQHPTSGGSSLLPWHNTQATHVAIMLRPVLHVTSESKQSSKSTSSSSGRGYSRWEGELQTARRINIHNIQNNICNIENQTFAVGRINICNIETSRSAFATSTLTHIQHVSEIVTTSQHLDLLLQRSHGTFATFY